MLPSHTITHTHTLYMSYPYMYWYVVHCMLASGPYTKVAVYCVYTCSTILCIYQVTIARMHGRTYIYN